MAFLKTLPAALAALLLAHASGNEPPKSFRPEDRLDAFAAIEEGAKSRRLDVMIDAMRSDDSDFYVYCGRAMAKEGWGRQDQNPVWRACLANDLAWERPAGSQLEAARHILMEYLRRVYPELLPVDERSETLSTTERAALIRRLETEVGADKKQGAAQPKVDAPMSPSVEQIGRSDQPIQAGHNPLGDAATPIQPASEYGPLRMALPIVAVVAVAAVAWQFLKKRRGGG